MLKPLGKRLLVKPIEAKQGGLFLAGAKPTQFTVVALGDEVTKVGVGDTIYLEKHYGVELQHGSDKFLVIEEATILAKSVD
jgi:co-chaperonin GroES (HSP10)